MAVFAERGVLVGRAVELAVLEEFAGAPALVFVRGAAGTGKSTLLGEVRRGWRTRGLTVLALRHQENSPQWDVFGAQPVIDLLRSSFHELAGARTVAAVAAVHRLCQAEDRDSTRSRAAMFAALVRLFTGLAAAGPVAVLVDDVHLAPDPVRAVAAACRAGCTVVAAGREDWDRTEPAVLSTLADRVLDLGPLAEAEVDKLLASAARGPLDESVAPAVRAALGSLAGNPGAALATLEQLVRDGCLVEVLGRRCLRESEPSALALPEDHHLLRRLDRFGVAGRQLVGVVARADRFGIDHLLPFAEALGHDLGECGHAVDRLVAEGVLDCDEVGTLSVPCPALAAAVVRGLGEDGVRAVHGAIARRLLRGGTAESTVLADHLALAGGALPADPALVPLLDGEAGRVLRTNPVLAARWFRAALRHAAPGSAGRVRLVLHLLVRTADYEGLAELVAEVVHAGAADELHYDLAAAAALAAIHLGRPVPGHLHDALARNPDSRAPLAFAARWFHGRAAVRLAEVAEAFAAFRVDHPLGAETSGSEAADGEYDVVAMLTLVLGAGYGEPVTGPLAVYRRLVRDYRRGDWSGIASAARRLELTGPPHTAIHQVARLLTAEVLSSVGDGRRATQWWELAGADCPFPAMRAWAEMGLRHHAGDHDRARQAGWAAYEPVRRAAEDGDTVGLRLFLSRLGHLEKHAGDTERLARVCAEAKRWRARFGGPGLLATELVLRGLSEHDHAAATAAVDLLREQGDLADLMRACMAVALSCEDPGPWYREALDIAKRLGEDRVGLSIRETIRKTGVTVPRARSPREALSDVELRIIDLVRQGMTNRQIATAVQMSEKTVENYFTRLFAKTGCRTRLDLATASLEGRLVTAGSGRGH